ncbi:MAG: rod shape-determining protein MreC [Saprospiraceae bacterium]|nr:rod shape-determining protein MreC [Candidatus Vicinibacter proximus]MBL7823586.1 rod shape-determining protein MreC [Saprospiraceae bacterium]MCC6841623.1 rod shape-determining protein MreC [Saprospiraceae bacterium]HRG34190.1 rod shape-determining protein MreC [Saprospiraceae bacterium]
MLNALRIIIRNGSFILFLVLQIICFYWIISYNQKQNKIYLYTAQLYATVLKNKYQNLTSYFSLKDKADQIADDNAKLLSRLLNLEATQKSDSTILDSTLSKTMVQPYTVLSARVINNSLSRKNNYLTLNKGGLDGLSPGMAVITLSGLVGIVTDTTRHFATVMSLLHSNSRISCSLKRSGFFGSLIWKDRDPSILQLEDIQKYADVRIGDTLVTSGYSIVFPKGLTIGYVKSFYAEPGAFTYTIIVSPSQDLTTVDRVYVINNNLKEEKEHLESLTREYE